MTKVGYDAGYDDGSIQTINRLSVTVNSLNPRNILNDMAPSRYFEVTCPMNVWLDGFRQCKQLIIDELVSMRDDEALND